MTTIRILPEILSNQIAAGEVVERPASVVKELVENSIDAKATRITIEIVKGGKSLIRVSDNGTGLLRDDALLSIERYATSKIFNKEDLFSISTMGFRGEALPSIASVSKFTLVSRTKSSDIGTKIDISGGKLVNVTDAGAPVGTMIEVKHLFFNTPARKKFLKSDQTEISHIADTISGMALGHSHIQFRLFINNKLQKSFSSSDDLFQRSVRVLGNQVQDKLYELEFSDSFIRIHGYCANPLVTRSTSSKIFLFVNNRLVYDRGLISAIFRGYRGRIMKGRFPLGVFFIDLAFDQVDINVHPSKKEVRFFDGQRVYGAMVQAVGSAFSRAQEDIAAYSKADILPDAATGRTMKKFEFLDEGFTPDTRVEQSTIDWQTGPNENKDHCVQEEVHEEIREEIREETRKDIKEEVQEEVKEHPITEPGPAPDGMKIIGQVMGTYIFVETKDGLMLIDQHAAHERVVYETLKKRYESLKVQSQSLVVPETLELSFREADFFTSILDDLKGLGFLIEPFGGTTFVIKSVPTIIDAKEITPLIVDIIETGLIKKESFSRADWLEKCLILMACHDAIRANHRLRPMEIEKLVMDLERCENPRHCPHGRPIMITWNRHQIEKFFKRLV